MTTNDLRLLAQCEGAETILTHAATTLRTVRGTVRAWCIVTDRALVLAERGAMEWLRRRRYPRADVRAITFDRTGLGPARFVVALVDGRTDQIAVDRAESGPFERLALGWAPGRTVPRPTTPRAPVRHRAAGPAGPTALPPLTCVDLRSAARRGRARLEAPGTRRR